MKASIFLMLIFPLIAFAQSREYTYVYYVPLGCEFLSFVMGFGKTPEEAELAMITHAGSDSGDKGGEPIVANTLYFGWPDTNPEEEEFMEAVFNMGPDHHLELELDYQSKGALYLCP